MAGLSRKFATILLLLSSMGSTANAALESVPIETILKGVVVGHYRGVTQNSFREATRFYHNDSPELARVRLELSQAEYFQKTKTLSFSVIEKCEEFAIGTATHRFLRISGMKFSEEFIDAEYVFRREDGTWKLWTSRMNPRADTMPFYISKDTKR